ncbi:MAG: SRPBCC domain-containing protein [Bacteroidetes bacterium]|nr:SRPBCC domain-containing protein [Bacteroidota bacterium]
MKTIFSKDPGNKKMMVTREFSAPIELVWKAWTDSNILDEWWAPKPWKAETKKMDFKEGGSWLYCMIGPDGSKHWSKADYKKVVPAKYFSATDYFCDENGNKNPAFPVMDWSVKFMGTDTGTKVEVEITFASEQDLQAIVEMGFEQGFSAAHQNLDELLKVRITKQKDEI